MPLIVEGALCFEFGAAWRVEKYDNHRAYRDGIERLKERLACLERADGHQVGSKAVDIVGVRGERLYLIEVKNLRRHRIENKHRLRDGELAIEVALKVRDTIAGLIGAHHRGGAQEWRQFVDALVRLPPKVLLWLEEDMDAERLRQRGIPYPTVEEELKKQLRWLGSEVSVVSQYDELPRLDLLVRNLPDGIVRLRERMSKVSRISREEFCEAWKCASQEAGLRLGLLCRDGYLRRDKDADFYLRGARWEEWHTWPL